VTGLIAVSYQDLKADSGDDTVALLRRISQQLEGTNATIDDMPSQGFKEPARAVVVNAFWLLSLIISLFSALVGISVKQWLRAYISWTEVLPLQDAVTLQRVYSKGFERYHVHTLRAALPGLLQLALVYFFVGLLGFLWPLNRTVFGLLIGVITIGLALVSLSIIIPAFDTSSPYKSYLSLAAVFATDWTSRRLKRLMWAASAARIRWLNQPAVDTPQEPVDILPIVYDWIERDSQHLAAKYKVTMLHALAEALRSTHSDKEGSIIHQAYRNNFPNSSLLTALDLIAAMLGYQDREEILKVLHKLIDYDTQKFYGACRELQMESTFRPSVMLIITKILLEAIQHTWQKTNSWENEEALIESNIIEAICLLDVFLWSIKDPVIISEALHAFEETLWDTIDMCGQSATPAAPKELDATPCLIEVLVKRISALYGHSDSPKPRAISK
jgi:hypothetical protein